MRVETLKQKIKYVLPSGECVLLVPGVPVSLPESAVQDLLRKAGAHVSVLFDSWMDGFHDPGAPITPGSCIAFRHDGVLRGGPADGGTVVKVVRHEGHWKCFTETGLIVDASLVRSVLSVNAHGQPIGCWTTKDHGLDGTTTREPRMPLADLTPEHRVPLADLNPEQRAQLMARFRLTPALVESLVTGAFWCAEPVVPVDPAIGDEATDVIPITPQLTVPTCRSQLTIVTKTGPHTTVAWMIGDRLAVHKSWAVQGWSITHCASGKAIRSRIASKAVALDAAQRVLGLPDCDWTEASIRAGAREAIVALLSPLPTYTKTRAPPRAPPT